MLIHWEDFMVMVSVMVIINKAVVNLLKYWTSQSTSHKIQFWMSDDGDF